LTGGRVFRAVSGRAVRDGGSLPGLCRACADVHAGRDRSAQARAFLSRALGLARRHLGPPCRDPVLRGHHPAVGSRELGGVADGPRVAAQRRTGGTGAQPRTEEPRQAHRAAPALRRTSRHGSGTCRTGSGLRDPGVDVGHQRRKIVNSSNRARNVACAGAFIVTLAVPAGVLAQTTSEEQTTSKGTSTHDGEGGVFRMGNSPSLRLGNQVRIDLHARVQADVSLQEESGAAWGNRRIGVDGVLFKRVEFQIEREFSDVEPWRDVFADARVHRALRIRAGHFKVPFSMERTTSDFDLDFISRAAAVIDISPGRETGIMLHGRGPRRFFKYEFGVFRLAEPPLKPLVESATDGAMLTAARFTFTPGTASIGVAFTESPLPEG